jgi:hypothetical protein
MANIKISDLSPIGAALFAGTDNLMGSIRDLTQDELKITGGGHSKSSKSKSKSSKSGSSSSGSHSSGSSSCGCGYGC